LAVAGREAYVAAFGRVKRRAPAPDVESTRVRGEERAKAAARRRRRRHYLAYPWVLVRLSRVGRARLQALMKAAWERAAPKKLRAAGPATRAKSKG
jgi:hypothetical protein